MATSGKQNELKTITTTTKPNQRKAQTPTYPQVTAKCLPPSPQKAPFHEWVSGIHTVPKSAVALSN